MSGAENVQIGPTGAASTITNGEVKTQRSVQGQTAIITGAGSGINYEFAKLMLGNGCNVVIGDLSLRPEAQELVEKYSSRSPRAIFHKTDVSDWKDLNSLFKTTLDIFKSFDIVCPGAGVFEPQWSAFWYPPGGEMSKDDPLGGRYKQVDINFTHPMRATQLAISHYMDGGPPIARGQLKTVVLISSIAGEIGFPPTVMYSATKWGIRGFVYGMEPLEPNLGIRVAGLCPAIVKTPIWLDYEDKKSMVTNEDTKDVQEWTTPEEVAEVMYRICIQDELKNSKGVPVSLVGGKLVEVVKDDIRNVPTFENSPPGTGTKQEVVSVVNEAAAAALMIGPLTKPGWGVLT